MIRRSLLVMVLVSISRMASAGPIIWEAFGDVASISYPVSGGASTPPPGWIHLGPPAGTPYSIRLVFDPTAGVQTPGHPGEPCTMTAATGMMNLGGFAYGLSGNVFTNSLFPAANCYVGSLQPLGSIDFLMAMRALEPDPWDIGGMHFLELKYWDLVHQNGTFPTTPTLARPGSLYLHEENYFNVFGTFEPRLVDVQQPSPVPEPGTLTMVGFGLAVAARRKWRARR